MYVLLLQSAEQLERKIDSHLCLAIRVAIATTRLANVYNDKTLGAANYQRKAGCFILIDTGFQSTMSGSGDIFDQFKKHGKMEDFSGFGEEPRRFVTRILKMLSSE